MWLKCYIYIVFIVSVFVDMYNGYVQLVRHSSTILPSIFKGGILLFSLIFLVKSKKMLVIGASFLILFLVDVLIWETSGYVTTFSAIVNDFVRLVYPFGVFIVLYVYKNRITKDFLLHNAMYFGLIIAITVVLGKIFGFGFNSYGDSYGYGTKGLFHGGNDISLSLLLSFCICSYYLMTKGSFKYIIFTLLFINSSLLVGSTAVMLGAIIIEIFLIVLPLFVHNSYALYYYKFRKLLFWLGLPLIFFVVYKISQVDQYTRKKFNLENIISGQARNPLKNAYYEVSNNFGLWEYLFGTGPEYLQNRVGLHLYGILKPRLLEVDYLTLFGTYGHILGLLILLYPFIVFRRNFISWLLGRDFCLVWLNIAIVIFVAHGIIAGHAYTSSTASVILMAIIISSLDSNSYIDIKKYD